MWEEWAAAHACTTGLGGWEETALERLCEKFVVTAFMRSGTPENAEYSLEDLKTR
jgi:hypothetical protein